MKAAVPALLHELGCLGPVQLVGGGAGWAGAVEGGWGLGGHILEQENHHKGEDLNNKYIINMLFCLKKNVWCGICLGVCVQCREVGVAEKHLPAGEKREQQGKRLVKSLVKSLMKSLVKSSVNKRFGGEVHVLV